MYIYTRGDGSNHRSSRSCKTMEEFPRRINEATIAVDSKQHWINIEQKPTKNLLKIDHNRTKIDQKSIKVSFEPLRAQPTFGLHPQDASGTPPGRPRNAPGAPRERPGAAPDRSRARPRGVRSRPGGVPEAILGRPKPFRTLLREGFAKRWPSDRKIDRFSAISRASEP